jgi:hypothetical protein
MNIFMIQQKAIQIAISLLIPLLRNFLRIGSVQSAVLQRYVCSCYPFK